MADKVIVEIDVEELSKEYYEIYCSALEKEGVFVDAEWSDVDETEQNAIKSAISEIMTKIIRHNKIL